MLIHARVCARVLGMFVFVYTVGVWCDHVGDYDPWSDSVPWCGEL